LTAPTREMSGGKHPRRRVQLDACIAA
jgi:hypothetical protein